ncbi:MAG: hypothetical protein JW819_06235, partial [Candidatus Krumholzibacteriota bacterium]|nr:hypothetical protein [Candidatus Krumholzibacteriota bacterium]
MKTTALALLALLLPATVCAAPSLGGLVDQEFPLLAGEGTGTIRAHLDAAAPLVLVVWKSDCPHCLENVVQAGGVDARLLGVNFDAGRWQPGRFAADRGVAYPQLHDPSGLVAGALGAAPFSITIAVLDGTGRVLAVDYDSVPDAEAAIRETLRGLGGGPGPAAAPPRTRPEAPRAAPPRAARAGKRPADDAAGAGAEGEGVYPIIQTSGRARVRWLGVGLRDEIAPGTCAVGGPYGEAIANDRDLIYRLRYEVTARVSPWVSAGGMIRVSNEDPALLERGPEYLSSEYGSAFVELARWDWRLRAGYYGVALTPLTLQRWDFADNPPQAGSGGAGGCAACGAAGRGVSLAALDDLGPEITFEGARLAGAPRPWLAVQVLYARPLRARDYGDPDGLQFRQDLLAGRAELSAGLLAGGRSVLGATYVAAGDDRASALYPPMAVNPVVHRDEVWSVDASTPLAAGLSLRAEVAHSWLGDHYAREAGDGASDWGYMAELSFARDGYPHAAVAWLSLGEEFAAAYGALTYRPGGEGLRATVDCAADRWGAAAFVKRLTPEAGAE